MKSKLLVVILGIATLIATPCRALTPQERQIIQAAQTQIEQAMQDYAATKAALVNASQAVIDADAHAANTDKAAGVLQSQVDDAYKREKALAADNAKMKPIYDACTRWGDLGAFVWGFKQLMKHVLWVMIGGIGLVIVIYALSFIFPIFGVILAFVVRIFTSIFHMINTALRALEAHLKSKSASSTTS